MAESSNTSTTANVPVVLQVPTSVKSLLEALIFGAREPLSARQIQALYEDQGTGVIEPRKISYEEIGQAIDELNAEFTTADRPYRIIQIAGGYQFATVPAYAEWLGKLYKEQTRRKLSQSSIETLAIIAYKQPITKPEIEAIRGVNCDYVLSALLEKDLATIVGRAPSVGRPLLYGTSKEFLRHFGLNDLTDLPRPREIQDILGDSQFETERRMLEAQQGVVEEKKEDDFKSRLPHIPKRKSNLDDEVRIIPRKKVRDIKVVPSEEAEVAKPDDAGPEKAQPEAIAFAPIQEADAGVTVTPSGSMSSELPEAKSSSDESRAISGNENSQEAPVQEPEQELLPETVRNSSTPLKMFEMPAATKEESTELSETEAHLELLAEEARAGLEMGQESQTVPAETDQVTESASVQPPASPSSQVEEEVAKGNESNDLQTSEKAEIQQSQTPVVAPAVESILIVPMEVPQPAAPTVEDRFEPVPSPEPEKLAEESQTDLNAPHPKTRWKSWKEKIQGFIKKLFG
jgi:segregation and condensation protein B